MDTAGGLPDQTWAVDTADARTANGQLVFDLRGKGSLPFLEGHLYEVAERGGPGFTPFISFSSNGQPFSVTDGGSTTAQHFRASVPVRNPENGHVAGQLSFTLDQEWPSAPDTRRRGGSAGRHVARKRAERERCAGRHPAAVAQKPSAFLLMLNRGFGNGMSTADNGQVISQGVLADGRVTRLAAAYASAVSDFELRLPTENTPAQWQAGLSVTVTVQ